MEPVPVAENLLETKLFGFSLKRLMQAFLPPMAPGLLLMVLNFPLILFGPGVIGGAIVGVVLYTRTPGGQSPAGFLYGILTDQFGPDEFYWKPVEVQEKAASLQDGTKSFTEAPSDTQEQTAMVGSENTIDNLDFQAVHDNGVIETKENYSIIVEITARPWLIADPEERESVYSAYSQFLMAQNAPIQIFTLPVPYDPSDYIEQLEEANRKAGDDDNKLLEYGRIRHARFVENAIRRGQIKDRRHFVVVTANRKKENEQDVSSGFLDRFKPSAGEDVDEEQRYDEVWSRAQSVTNSLTRTGVETEILQDREDVLRVLYYYYKGEDSPENMDHGWVTQRHRSEDRQDLEAELY
jgi:phage gpG-like protein